MPGATARVCNANFPIVIRVEMFGWGAALQSIPSQNGPGKWARQTVAARLESGEMPLCDWNYERGVVRPSGFEPPTFCSGGKRSIQLSYGRTL